jgi:ABC-type dipeptide/oligopeptide/nickel transport system ATPase component
MNGGRIVDLVSASQILKAPQHNYRRELLAAVPEPVTS